ncbi:hypothetical protein AVEN_201479-1 [Araneus ventricosus]|uniref:DUF4817 domain-containing protein n=1 Tax=Araneus ventricosus TaxID=182803 RepID=A0A4Y2NW80_ARAVE|nr:hypothetical protein AVEN_171243-1 [Araneus ventricosus]GBN42197.1 hypothetical protein AVEN_201479-1 [Araneus ventricosus]
MASPPQEKAQIVLWYAEHKSVITVQSMFRTVYKRNTPDAKSIKQWQKTFIETVSIQRRSGGNRRSLSDVEDIRQAFVRSPRKSIARAASELSMPRFVVCFIEN